MFPSAAMTSRVALGGAAVRTGANAKANAKARARPVRAAVSEPPAAPASEPVPAARGAARKKVVVLGSG